MFSNKMIVALVGSAMILTASAFANGVNSKPKQQKGKPVVMLAQGANAKPQQRKGKPVVA
jgi:hypothetical protein